MPFRLNSSIRLKRPGLCLSVLTVLCWAAFNLAAKDAIDKGFAPEDLMLLRFAAPAIIFLPAALALHVSNRGAAWAPPRRAIILSVLGGPLFGYLAVSGYAFAPLSHGLLFAPAAVLITGAFLGVLVLRESLNFNQFAGSALIIAGLAVLVGFDITSIGWTTLRGDRFFIAAGALWGCYTFLMRLWRIDPIYGTVQVGLISAAGALPAFFILGDGEFVDAPAREIALQALVQGLIGGVLSVFALIGAIVFVGATKAAMLPSLTPVAAMALSAMFLGTVPRGSEFLGTVIVGLGLLLMVVRTPAMVRHATAKSNAA